MDTLLSRMLFTVICYTTSHAMHTDVYSKEHFGNTDNRFYNINVDDDVRVNTRTGILLRNDEQHTPMNYEPWPLNPIHGDITAGSVDINHRYPTHVRRRLLSIQGDPQRSESNNHSDDLSLRDFSNAEVCMTSDLNMNTNLQLISNEYSFHSADHRILNEWKRYIREELRLLLHQQYIIGKRTQIICQQQEHYMKTWNIEHQK